MRFVLRSRALRRRSFVADTALNAEANIFLAGLGMASGILAARLLGPAARGELAAIQTWPWFFGTLAMLGMPEALVYYSARQPSEAGSYLGSAMVAGLASALPFMVLGYALMPSLLHAQAPVVVWAGRWYLLAVPILVLTGLPRHPMQGRSDFVPWNAMRIVPNVLWIAALVLAWACSRAVPTFIAAANLVALALLVLPFGLLAARCIPGPFRLDPNKLPSLLAYGLPCMITMVPQTLNARLDQMLMAAFMSPSDLGLYVVAVAWSGAVCPLLGALAAVTTPAVASADDREERLRRFAIGIRMAAALALMLAIAVAAITPMGIVILFGTAFKAAVPAALIMVLATGVVGLSVVLEEGLRGLGRPYAVLQAELAGLGMTALELAALLGLMGIVGAAIASLVGYSTVAAVLLLNAWRHAGMKPGELLFLTSDELAEVLSALVALARRSVTTAE